MGSFGDYMKLAYYPVVKQFEAYSKIGNLSGGGTGHARQRANVSSTDLARQAQGGALSVGSPRKTTREGAKLSSFGISGLRIPGGQ